MSLFHRFVWAFALTACQGPRDPDENPGSDTQLPDGAPQLGSQVEPENDGFGGDDTADTSDPDIGPPTWQVADIDEVSISEYGYDVHEFELHQHAPDAYPPLFDNPPRFWMLGPSIDDGEPKSVLMLFHGGGFGDDSKGDFPNCTQSDIEELLGSILYRVSPAKMLAFQAGWVVVIPRYEWCDGGMGLGPEDPGDPENHWGYVHSERVLDFVMSGRAGFEPSGELYGWGTSMGGTIAMLTAVRYKNFTGLVMDSAPSSLLLLWALRRFEDDRGSVAHVLGGHPYDDLGNPTEHWPRYASVSAPELVTDGTLRLPLYAPWNSQDQLTDITYNHVLLDAVNALPEDEDFRWATHDFNREFPGNYNHVQTGYATPPAGISPYAAFRFLQGAQLNWQEVEQGCTGALAAACDAGQQVAWPGPDQVQPFSGSAGVYSDSSQPAGTIWCDALPDAIQAGQTDQLVFGFLVEDRRHLEDDAVLATATYYEAGKPVASASFPASDFVDNFSDEEGIVQFERTQLQFVPQDPGNGHVCVEVTGAADLWLDAVVHVVD